MGQTLTHGVYLPNEGERNCYSGLASNWRLLDGAIGTVAAHTTAIAGKADISHTHGNISNDGKVGTTANLPLITGTGGVVQAGAFGNQANTFCEGNDSRLSDARTPVAHTHTKSDVTDLFNSANTWTQTNYFTKDITINSETAANAQSALSGSKIRQIVFNDNSNSNYFFRFRQYVDASSSRMQFNAQGFDSNNQAYSATFVYRVNSDGSSVLYPGDNNQSLGTSNNQWKTLNGLNPGALSIPDGTDSGANSSFTPDTTDWPKDGTAFQATMPIVGWLRITIKNVTGNYAFVRRGTAGANLPWQIFADQSFAANFAELTLNVPVTNATYTLKINSPGGFIAKVYPCLGNV